jgi:hypothetical protein
MTAEPCVECNVTGYSKQGWTDKGGFPEDQYGPCRCTHLTPPAEPGADRKNLCDDRGPRIGEDCPRCRRPINHTGVHQNLIEDGFGQVISW